MKKDTSDKTIDLDNLLNEDVAKQPAELTESVSEPVTEKPNMDWDTIIAEWFYRLPKGYAEQPYSNQELQILDQVINEYNNGGFKPVSNNIISENKQVVKEVDVNDIKLKASLIKKISDAGKTKQFATFLKLLPGGQSEIEVPSFLNSLTAKDQDEFVKKLYSVKTIEQIQMSDYKSGIGAKIFELEPKGIGKGELFLAMMIPNAKISGGGESFDLLIGNKKYEVKDYSDNNKGIRLGTKGKVTRFLVWKQILITLDVLNDLVVSGGLEFIKDKTLVDLINQINERGDFNRKGEFAKEDLDRFTKLYKTLNEFAQSDADGYTYVTFRGPNIPPASYTIKEVPGNLKKSVTLQLKDRGASESLIVDLRRLKYVRNPEDFEKDLQAAVDEAIGTEIPFIIFRPNGPIITKDFKFNSISIATIYPIEAELADRKSQKKKKD